MDAMIVDTPIVDPSVRRNVRDVHGIKDRIQRAKYFQAYLDKQWEIFDPPRDGIPFRWDEVSVELATDIEAAEFKADAATQKRNESATNFWT
ncbi:hypothetical protein [Streptomyces sp. NPDC058335]|uniref:hypothetical protein n=1 Tax=Streptomyces sp. NPDC058335 TaxID=3346451 RepID=UPI00364E240C